jgi:hypothetical protein
MSTHTIQITQRFQPFPLPFHPICKALRKLRLLRENREPPTSGIANSVGVVCGFVALHTQLPDPLLRAHHPEISRTSTKIGKAEKHSK